MDVIWHTHGCRRTCEGFEDDKTEGKGVHFGRELAAQILGRHIHGRAHDLLSLEMCGCDASSAVSVVFDAFGNAKVANATNTAVIQQHIGALDVTVDHMRYRMQVCQTTCNIRENQNPLLGRQGHTIAAAACISVQAVRRYTQDIIAEI